MINRRHLPENEARINSLTSPGKILLQTSIAQTKNQLTLQSKIKRKLLNSVQVNILALSVDQHVMQLKVEMVEMAARYIFVEMVFL